MGDKSKEAMSRIVDGAGAGYPIPTPGHLHEYQNKRVIGGGVCMSMISKELGKESAREGFTHQ
jgi:hypothetical protein